MQNQTDVRILIFFTKTDLICVLSHSFSSSLAMGPGDGRCDFVVHEPDVAVYNPTGLDPPVWEPRPEDIISMFQQLESQKV